MHGARGGAPEGERNGLSTRRGDEGSYRVEKAHSGVGLAVMLGG